MKIVITGNCAEGKTTIALLIEQALRDAGIQVVNHDDDVKLNTHYPQLQEARVGAIAERNVVIDLHTVQVRKSL